MKEELNRNENEVLRLNQELSILNAISQTMNQSIVLDEIIDKGLERIMDMIEVQAVGIYLLDERGKEIVHSRFRGFSKAYIEEINSLSFGQSEAGRSILIGEPVFIEDLSNHPEGRTLAVEEGIKSMAIIPLKSRGKVYGVLNIARRETRSFIPFEKNILNSIGEIISSAVERAYLYSENIKRLEEQKTLFSISKEIASRLELNVILKKIMESAVELLEAEGGVIVLWDNRKQSYTISLTHGLDESSIGLEFLPSSNGVISEVIRKKSPILYENYKDSSSRLKELGFLPYREVVGVPLTVREMIIGAMVIGTSEAKRHFRKDDIDLLFNFANQAAIAIGNAQLYEDSLARIRQLTTLYEIGKVLSSTLDLDELLKKALELLQQHWGYAVCGIFLLDRESNELYLRQIIGGDLEEVKHLRLRVGIDGIIGRVAKIGEPIYIPDLSKDSIYILGQREAKSEVAFPLKVRDQVIGVLDIQHNEVRGFDEEDLKLLSSFTSQVSIFIENAQLFSELKQTLRELKQAQEQIIQAEKLRALGEMASGVAHDFNNVLAAIIGNIQLILHQLGNLPLEEIRERLKVIEKASKDGAETVRRIQEFTGVRRDREFTPLSLNDLIREVAVITEPRWKDQAQKRGIQIKWISELGDIPPILGNPSELREVFTNIVFNAIDAMPEGGQITITTQPQSDGWVEIRISDTGIGMTEEVKRRIFDPFFTTKGVTSSGLGLSVSFGIIKRHGGEILVDSEIGKGTSFIIHLPTGYGEEIPVEEREIKRPAIEPMKAHILVIDDEDYVRDILYKMLTTKGHQVELASDGEEGIEKFKNLKFDLVFTDLGLPKVSGWDVGKAVKGINPKVPIVMITGWGMELDRDKMNESGIDLVLSKPFSFDQIIQIVSDAMQLKEKM